MATSKAQRELIELWLLASEGVATDLQLNQLSQLIESDAEARATLLELTQQQGWLVWNSSNARLPAAYADLARATAEACVDSPVTGGSRLAGGGLSSRLNSATEGWQRLAKRVLDGVGSGRTAWALVAGCVLGFLMATRIDDSKSGSDDGHPPAAIQATMVSSTGCVWGPGHGFGGAANPRFEGGESLQLLEGIADFRIRSGAGEVSLQMEGPASVVLTANGTPSLSYGKIIVTTRGTLDQPYPIETSFGRVLMTGDAEIGLVSFGSTAEVHSFEGGAIVESPWLQADSDEEDDAAPRQQMAAGEALYVDDVGGAPLHAVRRQAVRERFALQVPMTTDFLAVGPDYVREVMDSRPVAYWRFEGDGQEAGVVRNQAADRFHGQLKGNVRWVGPQGNRAIEFGVTPEPGSLIVAESWDDVLDGDFSLEAWIKPSHYHLGSIIGFIGEFDWTERRNKHGVLVEINGTSQPSAIHQPQRIRFLHRPVLGGLGGVSCFSNRDYVPRRWQHVAAVRDGDQLRLYLNGELVQEATDAVRMPLGLHLVIGQLYSQTVERFFIGHLDEVAIYDRALPAAEIARRHDMLRPHKADRAADVL